MEDHNFATKGSKTQSFTKNSFVKLCVLVSWWQSERNVDVRLSCRSRSRNCSIEDRKSEFAKGANKKFYACLLSSYHKTLASNWDTL